MKNLRKTEFTILFLLVFLTHFIAVEALEPISNTLTTGLDIYAINVKEFSTLYKGTIALLVLCNIMIYRTKKINEKITDHFESYALSWISLGMLINATFCAIAYQTDAFFETVFAVIGFVMSLYYLFSQYHEATLKKITGVLWLKVIIVILVDFALLVGISRNDAILIILFQNIFIMFWESYQFKKKSTFH